MVPEVRQPRKLTAVRRLSLWCGGIAILAGACAFFLGISNSRYLDGVNRRIAAGAETREDHVVRTFQLVSRWHEFDPNRIESRLFRGVARLEYGSPLHVSARTTLTAGVDRKGPCGAVSRTLIVLLRRAGFDARRAILHDLDGVAHHTVVEVYLDGEWRVLDPTYAWFWRRPWDGRIATAADLRDASFLASILPSVPHYPIEDYTYGNVYHLRWSKVPGLARVQGMLEKLLGRDRVQRIGTPSLYERPAFLIGVLTEVLGAVLVSFGILGFRRLTG